MADAEGTLSRDNTLLLRAHTVEGQEGPPTTILIKFAGCHSYFSHISALTKHHPIQSSRSREVCKPIVQMKLKYVKETEYFEMDRAENMSKCLETEHVMTKSAFNSAWHICSKSLPNGNIVFGPLTFEFHIYFSLLFGKLAPSQIILYKSELLKVIPFYYFELCRGMCSEHVMHTWVPGLLEALASLELELQMVVHHPTYVLGAQVRSSGRASSKYS